MLKDWHDLYIIVYQINQVDKTLLNDLHVNEKNVSLEIFNLTD